MSYIGTVFSNTDNQFLLLEGVQCAGQSKEIKRLFQCDGFKALAF